MTKEIGWGTLVGRVSTLRRKVEKVHKMTQEVANNNKVISDLVQELNVKRRERVITLLESEGVVICLTHSVVFRESSPVDFLVYKEQIKVVNINRTWTMRYRCYDGDPSYSTHGDSYVTASCDRCRSVLSHSFVVDKENRSYFLAIAPVSISIEFESLYSEETIDLISEKCFRMAPVTVDNILSL